MRPTRTRIAAVAAAAGLALASAAVGLGQGVAAAAPACQQPAAAAPVKVAQVPTWLESIIVDQQGRMFATDLFGGRVYRIDRPGATPEDITGPVEANGGIVVRPDGQLLVATGNDGVSYFTAESEILLVDPDTGAVSTYADGLNGIDGLALGPDGAVYTSTLGGTNIGRVSPGGVVDNDWAQLPLPNGIAVSPGNKYLYVVQSSLNPTLFRIPLDGTPTPERWVTAGPLDVAAVADGLTLDSRGRPLVATHVAGQIWRVEGGKFCTVQGKLFGSTQVTYGQGESGFSAGRLYRTGIDGGVYEVPAGREG